MNLKISGSTSGEKLAITTFVGAKADFSVCQLVRATPLKGLA